MLDDPLELPAARDEVALYIAAAESGHLLFPGKLIYFTLLMNFAALPLVRHGP